MRSNKDANIDYRVICVVIFRRRSVLSGNTSEMSSDIKQSKLDKSILRGVFVF